MVFLLQDVQGHLILKALNSSHAHIDAGRKSIAAIVMPLLLAYDKGSKTEIMNLLSICRLTIDASRHVGFTAGGTLRKLKVS